MNAAANGRTQPAAAPSRTNGKSTVEPPLTASQQRAILSICRRQKIDAQTYCQDEFGCGLEALTVREASTVIDSLLSTGKAGAR